MHLVLFCIAMKSNACHLVNASVLLQIASWWVVELYRVFCGCSLVLLWRHILNSMVFSYFVLLRLMLFIWSMAGCIIPDEKITDCKYENSVTLSICLSPTLISRCGSPVPHLLYTSPLVTILVFGIYADRQAKTMTSYLNVPVKSLLSTFSAGGEGCIIHEP